jgi:hypothetical protein
VGLFFKPLMNTQAALMRTGPLMNANAALMRTGPLMNTDERSCSAAKKPLMLLILFNPQPTARNLNQPPTILRLGSNRRRKKLTKRPLIGHQTEDARAPIPPSLNR